MIRFHNRVLDSLPASVPPAQRFAQARELVTKHYQWMVRTDYLPRICRKSAVDNVFNSGRKVFEVGATPTDVPTMPIEFSVAGFRLGHSMIRASYNWNKIFDDGFGTLDFLFTFSATSGNLGGETRLPSNWIADFRRLYDFTRGRPRRPQGAGGEVQPREGDRHPPRRPAGEPAAAVARRVRDPRGRSAAQPRLPQPHARAHGQARHRPADGDVHEEQGRELPEALEGPDPRRQERRRRSTALTQKQRTALLTDTPLWFYLLREAEFNGGVLRGVGARIVAETFHRAIEGSQFSIVRDPAWRPTLGPNSTTFRMVDLLLFAFEGKKTLLAPVG